MNSSTSNDSVQHSPLGKHSDYPTEYAPQLLFAIARAEGRASLGLDAAPKFFGGDRWTAYELSWLDERGKPCVAMAELWFPCDSAAIVESKSLKLYLNSFNQSRFASREEVADRITDDLSQLVQAPVTLKYLALTPEPSQLRSSAVADFELIDEQEVEINDYRVDPALLKAEDAQAVDERLVSHLLKSNCPVTGQPDWASLYISYTGPRLCRSSLLRYIVSYRQQADFHEHCVERIFTDILKYCGATTLTVEARYLRRGGLDINPIRSTINDYRSVLRTSRQ